MIKFKIKIVKFNLLLKILKPMKILIWKNLNPNKKCLMKLAQKNFSY